MKMVNWWNQICLWLGDGLWGWALQLSPEIALLTVGVLSVLILLIARMRLTNQDLLRRASADKRVLRERIRGAKSREDKEAISRLRGTLALVGHATLRQELWPLLAVLPPLALLGTWCMHRLQHRMPRLGEEVVVSLKAPVSQAGQLAHLVPAEGMNAQSGWIQRVEASQADGQAVGLARWQVVFTDAQKPAQLVFRLGGTSCEHARFECPRQSHGEKRTSRLELAEWRPLGVLPGIAAIGFAPWMMAYVLTVVPLYYLGRRILRVH